MALNADDTLLNGHYRIIRQLGRGGFGFVYLAQDTLLGEQVAIKELIPALVGDESTLKRFLAEAKATMRLTHERIVRTHNVFSESGNYYIVMECMPCGSLEERLREHGLLPVDEAVRIAAQVCEGLSYAHARGVVHCDLKPANILFTADGSAKVADFGIAHVSEEVLTRTWQTPAGFVAGTLPYMSPEQADGVRDDPRIDVYAVGAMLYRMLAGTTYLEFDSHETPGATADNVNRIRQEQPKPPSVDNARIPDWLDAIVLKALSKQPEKRYLSVDELRTALLSQIATEVSASPSTQPQTLASTQHRPVLLSSRHRQKSLPGWFWGLAGGITVLLVLIFIGLSMLTEERDAVSGTTSPNPSQLAAVGSTPTLTLQPSNTFVAFTSTMRPTNTSTPTPTALPTHIARPTATRTGKWDEDVLDAH